MGQTRKYSLRADVFRSSHAQLDKIKLKLLSRTGLYGGKHISNTLTQRLKKFSGSMIKQSIRRRIVAIAVGLIILMVATSVLSMVMVGRVGHLCVPKIRILQY